MASDEHQRLVKELIDEFKTKGRKIVCADYGEYPRCDAVGRHEPDVIARDSDGLEYIGEAETCDTLNNTDTIEQFTDFSNRVMKGDARKVPFFIAIPKSCENELVQTIKKNGLASRTNIYYLRC